MSYLESFPSVMPATPDVNQPRDIDVFEIQMDQSESVIWSYGGGTTTQAILKANFNHIQIEFAINERSMALEHFFTQDITRADGSTCRDKRVAHGPSSGGGPSKVYGTRFRWLEFLLNRHAYFQISRHDKLRRISG